MLRFAEKGLFVTSPKNSVHDANSIHIESNVIVVMLLCSHQYLGEEMDEFSGRTYHEPGSHITLPLLMLPGLVLVPGQTLPLHLFQPQVNKKNCTACQVHVVSTTSYHHCQMSKMEIKERHIYRR